MSTSRQFFIRLAIIVVVWYMGLSYLPQIVGTCFDGECSFSIGEIIVSLIIPLAFVAMPVILEMVLYKKQLSKALSDIGITRFNWTGIRITAVFLLPLLVFFPLFAPLTNSPLVIRPNWQWFVLSALLNNGLAEETMMRGFVFRHLREGRPFWHAAALSTLYFAGYHLVLILTAGVMFGVIGVLIAIPTGFLTAYLYERGNNTIWASALLHAVNNALVYIFVFPTDIQSSATILYLVVGFVLTIVIVVWVYRRRYGRIGIPAIETSNMVSA
jgi:membrane protease YdiL (CAAX protease family)